MATSQAQNMKQFIIILLVLIGGFSLFAQEEEQLPNFYIGVSYGTSYALGDFKDTDVNNPDAGFAKNGQKLDLYVGKFYTDKITVTGIFRYQSFGTEIESLIDSFNVANPGANFSGSTENWKTYYFLLGLAYQIKIGPKFDFFPRFGLGPLLAKNPGMNINAPNAAITQNFNRSAETGFGLGYEFGIGLKTDLGKRFALMPTFTFSGGLVTIPDVVTTTDNVTLTGDFKPKIQSFNLGLSLAYKFY